MSSPFSELRRRHTGPVVLHGDADWDDARRAWNLLNDQHPAAVALCGSVDDVRAVVTVANERNLRVTVQNTGHNATTAGPLTDTILLKTSPMRGVSVDPAARRARAEGGTIWRDVTEVAAPHGLAALAGSAPDVGVVGYTLGGGLSWGDGEASLAALLEPLRALTPEIDTFAPMPASALWQLKMDPEEPVPAAGGSVLLAEATPETVAELVRIAGPGSGSPLLWVELRHLGGALARRPEAAGVVGAIDGRYMVFGVGMPMDPDGAAAIDAHVATMTDALAPWKADRSVMNFTEHTTDPRAFFDASAYDRFEAVKRRYDPDDRLVASHPMEG